MNQSVLEENNSTANTQFSHRLFLGKQLYFFAWVIEIIAVIIGLGIAVATAAAGFQEMLQIREGNLFFSDYSNIIITILPFIMVAIVELTKIPFAGAFYHATNKFWKILFGFAMIFLAFITFESAMNGFERNFTALTFVIDKKKKEVVNMDEKITNLTLQKQQVTSLTLDNIESRYNERRTQLSKERDAQVSIVSDRMNTILGASETDYITSLKKERSDLRNLINKRERQYQSGVNRLNKRYTKLESSTRSEIGALRRTIQGQINQLSQEIKNKEKDKLNREAAEKNKFVLFREDVSSEAEKKLNVLRQRLVKLQDKLNNITAINLQSSSTQSFDSDLSNLKRQYRVDHEQLKKQLRQINRKISKIIGRKQNDTDKLLQQHRQEIKIINSRFKEQESGNDKEREEKLKILQNNQTIAARIEKELLTLSEKRTQLRDDINVKVGDNQVYRIAQWWSGKESADDLDRHEVMLIATIWFGSLALLIAVTGILLALASYVIRDPTQCSRGEKKNSKITKIINSIRRYFIYKRRVQREPIVREVIKEVPREVIREVPVDKVVTVEKPVDIIRKVLVHVPFYTNDPKLLKISNNPDDIGLFKNEGDKIDEETVTA
jgi:hypothetical protein